MPQEARKLIESFSVVARGILQIAHEDRPPGVFFHDVSMLILHFSACEELDIYLLEAGRYHRITTNSRQKQAAEYETIAAPAAVLGPAETVNAADDSALAALCCGVVAGRVRCTGRTRAAGDCFWTDHADEPLPLMLSEREAAGTRSLELRPNGAYPSIAAVPFDLDRGNQGLLLFKTGQSHFFNRDRVALLKGVARLLGMPIVHRRTQLALRERIKELTCLCGIAKLVGPSRTSLESVLAATVELLPPAWLYPGIASARIVLDTQEFRSATYRSGCDSLRSEIVVSGAPRGFAEVNYCEKKPELDEGPFLSEERNLIDVVAKEISLIVDQHSAQQQRAELNEQLRHADRLATIGQLSAGVAHELNEPLGTVLGFAQLAQKVDGVPKQVQDDLAKIVAASLHAREVVKKLMLFARQSQPEKTWVDLNALIADGLYFLESRCSKSDIQLNKHLDPGLPELKADTSQIYQVLINLAVNAIQAMPDGGALTIRTLRDDGRVVLEVEDTGVGMPAELQQKAFLPFFTTKDVGEGTGLGLSVVQGIVTSHGGTIRAESEVGTGTKFSVYLPLRSAETSPTPLSGECGNGKPKGIHARR